MVDAPISVTSIDETPLVFDFSSPNVGETPTVCLLVYAAMGLRSTPCVFVLSIPSMQFFGGNNLELVGWFSGPQDNCSLHLIQCDQYVYMHI